VAFDHEAEILRLQRELRHGHYARAALQAEALLDQLPQQTPAALELRLLRANAWRRGGRQREAEAELEVLARDAAAAEAAGSLPLRVRLEQAKLIFVLGHSSAARAAAEEILAAAEAAGETLVAGDTHFLIGLILSLLNDKAASQRHFEQGLAIFEALRDEFRIAEGSSLLGMVLVNQGRNYDGIQLWRRALAFHESDDNPAGVATELQRIGYAAWCEGDLEQTRRTLQRVLSLGEHSPQVLSLHVRLMAEYNLAAVEVLDGRPEVAEPHLATADELAIKLDDRTLQAAVHALRARIALQRGRYRDALLCRSAAQRAAAEVAVEPDVFDRMLWAVVEAANGDLAAARQLWPAEPLPELDGDMRMHLREMRQLLDTLLQRAGEDGLNTLYAEWAEVLRSSVSA
jgi:tetratricopeptide (TPR) repeat protein